MTFGWPAPEVEWAILLCFAAPFILMSSRWLRLGVAQRFGVTAIAVIAAYALACLRDPIVESRIVPLVTGAALIAAALVFVLGVWGVLTRGYSVALLITLEGLGRPTSTDVLERSYSAGRGLRWLTEKRLNGLKAAHVVVVSGDQVIITHPIGSLFVLACTIFQKCFRLKDYG
jgi:hypothetical protein